MNMLEAIDRLDEQRAVKEARLLALEAENAALRHDIAEARNKALEEAVQIAVDSDTISGFLIAITIRESKDNAR